MWYKGTRIKYSSELRKHENENIKNIEKELNSLEALYASIDNTDLNIETKLLTLKNEPKSYFEKKKPEAKWIHEAERREIILICLCKDLVTDNGQLVAEFKDVLNEQLNCYSSLYSSRETVESWDSELVDQFFITDNDIPKLDEADRE